ncbi:DoxX family protein [Rhodococcus qingshengii]|uniref:DoxX family protein n=1 Tax=Rhodococcus qingshengii TaxID=334542 RepID=UPI00237CB796|nr:DoxX family protein [Rhodococcus qingshengii]WCT05807.1 DoxX family protein [Rhodococcus qingshengii]
MATTLSARLSSASDYAIAAFRIVVGFLFFCHGTTSLWSWPTEPYGGANAAFGAWPGWWGAIIQIVGGIALMLGLGTRLAAFIGSGSMAYAYFWSHQEMGALPMQNGGESAALFCWALFLLVFIGAGTLSVDRVLERRRSMSETSDGASSTLNDDSALAEA